MEKGLIKFISENNLSAFAKEKTSVRRKDESVFKTKEAKQIFNRVLDRLSSGFVFKDTDNLWNCFPFTQTAETIKSRQDYFKNLKQAENSILKQLTIPKITWKPKYSIVVATSDEKSFSELKKLDCPVQFITSESDIQSIQNEDIIQAVDCEDFSGLLEQLPQTVFLDSTEEAYLERYLEQLSSWKSNLEILNNNTNEEIQKVIGELIPLLDLTSNKEKEKMKRENVEITLEKINSYIEQEISKLNISGTVLMSMLSKGKLPEEIETIVNRAIKSTNLPETIFSSSIPVAIDEKELEKIEREQNADENTGIAEKIKKNSDILRKIPEKLKQLENLLILFDFESGISKFLEGNYPKISSELIIEQARNLFLEQAQEISFNLSPEKKCSILTGANSGGKTTLLEHILQLISLFQIGLPVSGNLNMPIFTDVYYFAKTKGSTSKGAFETLLGQMNIISPGEKTLILADEIEAVTEPGVAGKIITATCEYFISKSCFLVIATHLGQEIQKNMPPSSRMDGIEAKGLDEYFELIVDHNPVLGKLASSTPELIVEKLSSLEKTEYFQFLNEKIKNKA